MTKKIKKRLTGVLVTIIFCTACYFALRLAMAFLVQQDYKDTQQVVEYFNYDELESGPEDGEGESEEAASQKPKYSLEDIISQMNLEEDEDGFASYKIIEHSVKSGEDIAGIMRLYGAEKQEVEEIIAGATKKTQNIFNIRKGQVIRLEIKQYENDKDGSKNTDIQSITMKTDFDRYLMINRSGDGFLYDVKIIELKKRLNVKQIKINNSLFYDATRAGLSHQNIMSIIAMYSYDIDFARDLHDGDALTVATEELTDKDGKSVKTLKMIYSKLKTSGSGSFEYFYYEPAKHYFNANGESAQKGLLRTPINGARISSKFGHRRHPILGYTKLHKGIDFAAPKGTPVFAAGEGTIIYRGVYKGYGNYVKIRHNSTYSTAYAHLSRFSSKFRNGSRVKQGHVIGYVGSTGFSTGNHLHYELHKNGSQINPQSIKTRSYNVLSTKQLKDFKYRFHKFKKDNAL